MPYANLQDMIEAFSAEELLIVADDNDDGQIDESSVNQALDKASAKIDLYIGTRYDLPLPVNLPDRTVTLLKELACDLAIFRLSNDTVGDSDKKTQANKDAIDTLTRISEGKLKLAINTQDTDADGTEDAQADIAEITSQPRLFTRTTMAGL